MSQVRDTLATMRIVLDPPPDVIAERLRLGLDGRDEVWEGEYHLVPPASSGHMRLEFRLARVLALAAESAGLELLPETGLYDPKAPGQSSFRVPDLVVISPEHIRDRGVEGQAELVIEIRSPGDETFQKIPFYERVGVQELLVVDRDTKALRHWIPQNDRLVETADTPVALRSLDGRLWTDRDTLVVETAAGTHRI
jgi:Uma2 family endonuclease